MRACHVRDLLAQSLLCMHAECASAYAQVRFGRRLLPRLPPRQCTAGAVGGRSDVVPAAAVAEAAAVPGPGTGVTQLRHHAGRRLRQPRRHILCVPPLAGPPGGSRIASPTFWVSPPPHTHLHIHGAGPAPATHRPIPSHSHSSGLPPLLSPPSYSHFPLPPPPHLPGLPT